ncbi:MAG: hypothetical protein HA496_04860 [Thaumarchaeota archaeon]|jgi:predicted nucleic acid-binding protein|nr:hypothetical protein [Nitrososphaerota archaeon]
MARYVNLDSDNSDKDYLAKKLGAEAIASQDKHFDKTGMEKKITLGLI